MQSAKIAPVAASAAVLVLALGGFVWRCLTTAELYTHTYDEPSQIASGLELLQYGRFELHTDAPPLAKVLIAAPLFASGVRLSEPPRHGEYLSANQLLYGGNDYWAILRTARAVATFVGVLLLLAIYAAGLTLFGPNGALAAVVVASVMPGLVSASSIANSDAAGVLTVLFALWAFRRLIEEGGLRRAALFGFACGLAVATKLSALPFLAFSLPVVAIFILRRQLLEVLRHPLAWGRAHGSDALLAAAVIPLTIWATYGFHSAPPVGPVQAAKMSAALLPRWPSMAVALSELSTTSLPFGSFVRGLGVASLVSREGHPAYLMGHYSLHGWPQYFLVTLALKVPIGILIAVAVALALALRARKDALGREVLLILAVAVAILASVARAGINAGHRHIIVVEALFALAIGGGVVLALRAPGIVQKASLALLGLGMAAGVVSSVRAHPDALGYTNALAGPQPDWWFVDSNLDWGQDLDRLARWLDQRGIKDPVHLAYFGTAEPARHGLRYVELTPGERPTGWVAASVHYQRGLYGSGMGRLPTEEQREAFSWLLNLPEAGRVGTSIRIYDVTPADLARLASTK
jgi:4-amino-4-deoxy-L-arabinose transferase-like glycosyltransferase